RYGALRKLKQVGGYVARDYTEAKGKKRFFSNKILMPEYPTSRELTLNKDKKAPSVVACIKIGWKSAPVEAQLVAKEVESMVQRMSLEDYITMKNTHGQKKKSVFSQ
ncbi:hypothetical protein PFISCL1PPCAC_11447, partial [Pristionchus fissidentatus]